MHKRLPRYSLDAYTSPFNKKTPQPTPLLLKTLVQVRISPFVIQEITIEFVIQILINL